MSNLREKFDLRSTGRMMLGSSIVGLASGIVAVLFILAISYVQQHVLEVYSTAGIVWETTPTDEAIKHPFLADTTRTESVFGVYVFPRYWVLILLVPAIGGLFCSLLVYTFAPEAEGEGTDEIVKTYHHRRGMMRFRVVPIKFLASITTIGSGGSAGWEGPLSLMGGGVGVLLSRYFKVDARERRILLLAGTAGCIGAVFQSPFGGALFAAEILYCSTALEISVLFPCIVASWIGYATCSHLCNHSRNLVLPENFAFFHGFDFFWFIVFAYICALVGLVFVKTVHGIRNNWFSRMLVPELFKPALGGMMLGCVALFLPQVRGGGYEYFQPILDGTFPLKLLSILIVCKIIATAFTVSSGGSGGLLVPSLLLGAMIGSVFGMLGTAICTRLGCPGLSPDPCLFALIGMGSLIAGIGKIPFTATILVCDMIGSYELLAPLLLVGFLQIAIHSPRTTLFREQLPAFEDSPAHLGDFSTDLLRGITVGEICDPNSKPQGIPSDTPLRELVKIVAQNSASVFPVIESPGNFLGLLSANDVRSAFQSHGPGKRMTAADLTYHLENYITDEDNLETALRRMTRWSVDVIPVVSRNNKGSVIGFIRKEDIQTAYHARLAECTE